MATPKSVMEQLNQLTAKQEELAQQMSKIMSKMKKDSSSRKTGAYLENRLANLEEFWERAQQINKEMVSLKNMDHQYFTSSYFQQMEKLYESIKSYIGDCRKKEGSKDEEATVPVENIDNHVEELRRIIIQINRELTQDQTKTRYEILLNKLKRKWEKICVIHEHVLSSGEKLIEPDQFYEVEAEFEEALEKIMVKKEARENQDRSSDVMLPKIELPIFSGGYEEWASFSDLFKKVIDDNAKISKAEKMHYLKSHVRGEAWRLIQHLPTTELNYKTALTLLTNRYKNERLLLSKLIDKILDLPSVQKGQFNELRQMYDTTMECLQGIDNIGVETKSWGPIIVRIISRKWDQETKQLYEQSLQNSHEIEDYFEMMDFLRKRFQSLETASDQKIQKTSGSFFNSSKEQKYPSCRFCQQQHSIHQCKKFKELSVSQRIQAVQERKLCRNCMNHQESTKCFNPTRCDVCKKFHNILLHKENNNNFREANQKKNQNKSKTITSNISRQDQDVLLATAIVKTKSLNGNIEPMRALIDPGSQASFITERAAQVLSIPRQKIKAEVTGLGEGSPKISTTKVEVEIIPHFPSKFLMKTELLVLNKLTQTLPQNQVDCDLQQWKNHMLADPTYFRPGPIDIIIGAADYSKMILNGIEKTEHGLLAQNSEFGWLVSGTSQKIKEKIEIISMVARCEEDEQLTKFWEMQEITEERELTSEERKCEDHYKKTTKRNKDGTYTVKIPFKESAAELGESKHRAVARFVQLEKKFKKNQELEEQYKEFMQEYLDLGHMQRVPNNERNQGYYYIPHQAVLREDSTTTKLRVVYDASCKTSSGISLNEIMHTGPRLQQELSDILVRWRLHRIAFSADIEKMYRQIKVDEEDQKYQRILWRFDSSQPIEEYSLTTVTYGTSSAPYLAVRTLQRLADDEAKQFPRCSEICKRDFYVDDLLSGADNDEEAMRLQTELITMLQRGGFSLRKWSSNNIKLVKNLPKKLQDEATLKIFEDGTKKSLGLHWAPNEDVFCFKTIQIKTSTLSKRHILSEISKLFDPLGWLAPIIIQAKLLIQELWVQSLGWDEVLPSNLQNKWLKFQGQLLAEPDITLPRWINYGRGDYLELHGFCDASEKAYGAAIYSRIITKDHEVHVHLLVAKSKVAPLKSKATLPRLELCAAELLAKLIAKTTAALGIEELTVHAWTDSMITLGWIRGDPQRWKTFVANRVARIQNITNPGQWHHVRTEDNPADMISRGVDPSKLRNNALWWHGPAWLQEEMRWSEEKNNFETNEEMRVTTCNNATVRNEEQDIIERFSNLTRMMRVLSFCRRFISRCRGKDGHSTHLQVDEMNETMTSVIKMVQRKEYGSEIRTLKKNGYLEKSNSLSTLSPFIDDQGLLRVGGRLQNSSVPYNEQHPIILPSKNHLTQLIIDNAHVSTLHGGIQLTLAYIRRKYWIINGKKAVSSKINKCTKCIRYKAQAAQQLMGSLPAPRVTPSPPFTHAGVDYAGPIQVRATKGRGHKSYKGYISIFVCFSTKAVHIEVVSDMTTEAFLAAYRRFVARRGTCAHIYSDNGTTFVGASKLLSSIPEKLATEGTQWHFIPPSAPHFGGLWEAGVKSMKHHLKRVIGETTLTYEELTTLIYQIEACLNSRPLCPLSNNPEDMAALTPGHFLAGRALLAPCNPINNEKEISTLARWRMVQKIKGDFWKSWSSEYLTRLQQKYKWKIPLDNAEVGQMVLIKEDNINPCKWPLARIQEVHTGQDGRTRVVTLKQASGGTSKRPIHKLIRLPINTDEGEEEERRNPVNANIAAVTINKSPKKEKNSRKKFWLYLVLLTVLGISSSTAEPTYTIKVPKPGLYIEHIGQSHIERGFFKMTLRYQKSKLREDVEAVTNITQQMTELCQNVKTLSDNSPCDQLTHHLQGLEKEVRWIEDSLNSNREKRGLLGKMLTSLFGVNDEVYQDIDELDKNQQELIRASSHQTKFMLSTLAQVNETEKRISNKLQHFQDKLNEGIQAIDQMSRWYNKVDANKLSIHVLVSYQMAENFANEIINCYSKLLKVQYNQEQFHELMSPKHIEDVIVNASRKLPSNIKILSFPLLDTKIERSQDYFQVHGIFPIAEVAEFELMKTTPVPLQIKNGTFWTLDVSRDVVAVDYNSQLYFQLNDDAMKSCITVKQDQYLCDPTMVRSIESNPNCVIDEIYQRTDQSRCEVKKMKVTSLMWIQLYMTNTWMFITDKPTRIALICNGVREDLSLNETGIIQISQECIIKTKKTILSAKRTDNIRVLTGFNKHVSVFINATVFPDNHPYLQEETEPVLGVSGQLVSEEEEEEEIQDELGETTWKQIKHHTTISSSVSGLVVLVLGMLGITIRHLWNKRQKGSRKEQHRAAPETREQEMVELRPIFPPDHNEE